MRLRKTLGHSSAPCRRGVPYRGRPHPREAAMIRLGILDFDTSHVVEFTQRLNHKHSDKDQWVDGAAVVVGCPGESKIMPERIAGYTQTMEKLGVPLVAKP